MFFYKFSPKRHKQQFAGKILLLTRIITLSYRVFNNNIYIYFLILQSEVFHFSIETMTPYMDYLKLTKQCY